MPNMENVIRQHNSRILRDPPPASERNCNCRKPDECPLNGECLSSDIVYKAVIKTDQDSKEYIGSCSTTFKLRYDNHKSSLANRKKMNDTESSFRVC